MPALISLDGHGVIRGSICLPRVGAWHAELEVDATKDLTGKVTITAGGLELKGTVSRGEEYGGINRVRIVAGADGLRKTARPQHYTHPTVSRILADLAKAAGETVAGTIASSVSTHKVEPAWTVLGVSVGEQLSALCDRGAPAGSVWRMLSDGTLWVGIDSFPKSTVKEWRELDQGPRERRVDLGLDAPTLLPGTTLGIWRIDYVEHVIEPGQLRARIWWTP